MFLTNLNNSSVMVCLERVCAYLQALVACRAIWLPVLRGAGSAAVRQKMLQVHLTDGVFLCSILLDVEFFMCIQVFLLCI